jgi:hypothetical protein
MVPVTYSLIRSWHFTETLAGWLKGLDKAALALIAVAGPGMIAIIALLLLAIADGLAVLSTASSPFTHKLAAVCTWQLTTLATLWPLREAVLMPRAASFFAALPVSLAQQLRSDIALCVFSYSLLWLAAAWAIGKGFFAEGLLPGMQILLLVTALIAYSVFANLLLLRLGLHAALPLGLGLLAFTLPGPTIIRAVCTLAATALCLRYLWHAYGQPRALNEHPQKPHALIEALAVRSGLVTLLCANELRAALSLRLTCVFGLLVLMPLIWRFKPDAGLETAGFVVVMAAATVAFYDLPALCRSVAFAKLRFIAGQRNFVRRVTVFSHGMQAAVYLSTFFAAHFVTTATPESAHRFSDALLVPSVFFAAVFLAGTIAANLEWLSVRWLMPVVNFIAAVVMSGFV